MFDRAEFDRLLTPRFGYGAMPLERAFAHVVAAGWVPRYSRAMPDDLFRSVVQGDCLQPLLFDGDEVWIDCSTQARSGDLAFHRLSFRGAALLNQRLAPGQAPWQGGQNNVKLLVRSFERDLLLERHGGCVPAQLLAAESDDEMPELHPVVNVRRAGKMLFRHGVT